MLNYVFYCLFCCLFRHRDRICDAFTDIEVWIGKNRTQVFGFHCAEMEKNVSKHFIHRPLVWVKVLLEPDYKSWKLKFPCILRLQPSIFYDESISLRNVIEQLLNMSPNSFSSSTRDDSLELLSLFFKNSLQVRSLHSVFNL